MWLVLEYACGRDNAGRDTSSERMTSETEEVGKMSKGGRWLDICDLRQEARALVLGEGEWMGQRGDTDQTDRLEAP